jgi:hypothetical protein
MVNIFAKVRTLVFYLCIFVALVASSISPSSKSMDSDLLLFCAIKKAKLELEEVKMIFRKKPTNAFSNASAAVV